MAIVPSLLSWQPTLKFKSHNLLYHHSPQPQFLPSHASFPLRKNVTFKCFFTAGNYKPSTVSGLEINKYTWLKQEMQIKQNPVEIVATTILKALKALAASAVLLGFLLIYSPNSAFAASGGLMGGSSFSSGSSSSWGSSSSEEDSPSSWRSYSTSTGSGSSDSVARPLTDLEAEIVVYTTVLACIVTLIMLYSFCSQNSEATNKTSVLKLQVGLLGLVRSLQKDLNRIAETADTSTPEGLHYVLTETVLALLKHPDYYISAYSSVDVKRSMEAVEKRFNQLSTEERGKFDEETLVNIDGVKNQSSTSIRADGFSNEYLVITILVAAEGGLKLPTINNNNDLKEALQKLASIPKRRTMAVEVLWTPQKEGDTLSEQQLLDDYPFLLPL